MSTTTLSKKAISFLTSFPRDLTRQELEAARNSAQNDLQDALEGRDSLLGETAARYYVEVATEILEFTGELDLT